MEPDFGRCRLPVYLTNDLAQLDQLHGTPVERCALIHGVVTALLITTSSKWSDALLGNDSGDDEPEEQQPITLFFSAEGVPICSQSVRDISSE